MVGQIFELRVHLTLQSTAVESIPVVMSTDNSQYHDQTFLELSYVKE